MTPESCLVRMSFNPELYENVGLFVFDECHLLHSKTQDVTDKRCIDSMLCLLRILELSPDVDLLLMSAMLSNNEELASWLSTLIQRNVLSLSMKWKPTRQAKGCVQFPFWFYRKEDCLLETLLHKKPIEIDRTCR
jgi:replicative superfamily II helicase